MTTLLHGVIWITGLSGAGKTTLATALHQHLRQEHDNVILLDGDQLRQTLLVTQGSYDRQGRLKLAHCYARLARMLASQKHIVIVATISLFNEIHHWNRQHQTNFIEVFLDPPKEQLQFQDAKGLYQSKSVGPVVGREIQAESPLAPHFHIKDLKSISKLITQITQQLEDLQNVRL